MNKRLGICIPTYKRPDQLQWCLESVLLACRPHSVPIFVTDDACDQTNQNVRAWLCQTYPHVVWEANEENRGIDGNILHAVDMCTCEYAWLLGEDDRLLPHGVSAVLDYMDSWEDPYPFLYVNYASVDSEIKIQLKEQALPLKDNILTEGRTFAREQAWAMGFIGGCVIRKRNWNAHRTERYTGTYFAHAGHILEITHGHDVPMIAESLVLNRCGDPRLFTWTDSFFDVLLGWERMVKLLPASFDSDTRMACVDAFEKAHGLRSVKFLIYARAEYAYNRAMFKKYILPRDQGLVFNTMAWLVTCIPPVCVRPARCLLQWIRRWKQPAVKMTPA